MHPFETSHSARLSDFAKLAELHNREELYLWPKRRQYRNVLLKSLTGKHLRRFVEMDRNFPSR
jgi:hypothetical protein